MKQALRLAAAAVLLVAASALGVSSAQADTTPIPTHMTVTITPNVYTYGQTAHVTMTVVADDPNDGPVDSGNFGASFPGGGMFFEEFHNPTTVQMPLFPAGTSTFTAHYGDASGRFGASSASASVTVLRSDTTTTLALNHTTAEYGEPVTATATMRPYPLTSVGIFEGDVTFTSGTETASVLVGGDGTASYTLPRHVPGSYSVAAVFRSTGPLANFNGSASGTRSFTVTRAATKTILAVTNLRYHQTPVAHTTITSKYEPADGTVRLAWRRGGRTLHQKVVPIHNGYMQTPLWRTGIRGTGATVVATFLGTANQASSTRSVAVTVR